MFYEKIIFLTLVSILKDTLKTFVLIFLNIKYIHFVVLYILSVSLTYLASTKEWRTGAKVEESVVFSKLFF